MSTLSHRRRRKIARSSVSSDDLGGATDLLIVRWCEHKRLRAASTPQTIPIQSHQVRVKAVFIPKRQEENGIPSSPNSEDEE
jgi:hypothetical protein